MQVKIPQIFSAILVGLKPIDFQIRQPFPALVEENLGLAWVSTWLSGLGMPANLHTWSRTALNLAGETVYRGLAPGAAGRNVDYPG